MSDEVTCPHCGEVSHIGGLIGPTTDDCPKCGGVVLVNPNLIPYRVTLREELGDDFLIVFDCMAEDDDHAAEQAENAYPQGEVFNVTFFPGAAQ